MPCPGSPLRSFTRTLIIIAPLLGGCGAQDDQKGGSPPKRQGQEHLVTLHRAEPQPVSSRHERPGSLRLRKVARIFAQEEGRVTALVLFEGDEVEQGQLLVQLDDELLRAEYDKASATTEQSRLDLDRLEGLRTRRAASEDEVAKARTALRVAEAEERLLQTRLNFTEIYTPFAGIVTERLVEPGDFVTKNTHLLTVADPASLIAEVYASELVIPHLRPNDPVEVRIDALGNTSLSGRILRIHPTLTRGGRQGIVEIQLKPVPDGARAGQFVRARLTAAPVERLLVPFRAIRRDRSGELLWVVGEDGVARRREVRTGLRIADRVEILDGLMPGELVVTRGFLGLKDGDAVKSVETAEEI